MKPKTIKDALTTARQQLEETQESPSLEAEILLAHCLDCTRTQLHTWPEKFVSDAQLADFEALVYHRLQGEPIAYLTGVKEFWGLPLKVTPQTLIPRPETELLVELALASIPVDQPWSIADLGTGCGAIAMAIAKERPHCQVTATDKSPQTLELAEENAGHLKIDNIQFYCGDWFQACPVQQFDVVLSNPPYVAPDDPHLQQGDLRYEPLIALKAANAGLADLQKIIANCPEHLAPDGWLMVEHGFNQGDAVASLFNSAGFDQIVCHIDYAMIERVTVGKRHLRHI